MMKLIAAASALALLAGSASAETDIEKAWAACSSQGLIVANQSATGGYKPGYESCPVIHDQLVAAHAADTAARERAATAAAAAAAANDSANQALIKSLTGN